MSSEYTGITYNPDNLVMFGGNYTKPNAAGMQAWSPAFENPNVLFADTAQINPTVPGFAAKLRDFNSEYGSTITGGLQAAGGLWGAYNGMQQTKLAKQQMANSLNQWDKNYANQVGSYNTRLEDRQRARVGANPNAYESVDSYMQKNRLK